MGLVHYSMEPNCINVLPLHIKNEQTVYSGRCKRIAWTSTDVLYILNLGTTVSEILTKML